jgi:hypothetical protein
MIPALVLAPNIIVFLKGPTNTPADLPKEPATLTVLERLGQIGCFISPAFFPINISGIIEIFAIIGIGLMLAIYYTGWIRFFTCDREYRWLSYPLFSIPVPMALSPVVYFLLSSVILHSIPLLISSIVLAAGHIPISVKSYKRIKGK